MKKIQIFISLFFNVIHYIGTIPRWVNVARRTNFSFKLHPRLLDKTISTNFDRHYVYHVAWAQREVINRMMHNDLKTHVDIGSSLYFVTGIANSFNVEFVDVRPPELEYYNLKLISGDVTQLPYRDNTVESMSMLHVLEHLGLGRYGDRMNPNADVEAAAEISRVLRPGAYLYLVTPTGRQSIHYNAHKVYSIDRVIDLFSDLELVSFNFLRERSGGIIENCDPALTKQEVYGCGMYIFKKN